MFKELVIAVALSVVLTFSDATFAEQPHVESPGVEQMLDELNNDFLGFVNNTLDFTFEQDGDVLIFHTGKTFNEVFSKWRKYQPLVERLSNNWRFVSGCGIVVVVDIESKTVFATDNKSEFYLQYPEYANPKIKT